METKKQIRTRVLEKRRALTIEERDRYSKKICSLIIMHPLFQSAREIYCYASFREEVQTFGIMEEAWREGKRVAVPRVLDAGKMEFFYIESLADLLPGYYGIPEPVWDVARLAQLETDFVSEQTKRWGTEGEQVLMLLPGAVFDKRGNRIGYGKGFYDRYLQEHPKCCRIGLAYSIQCVEKIQAEPFDIRVEAVITEKGNYMI